MAGKTTEEACHAARLRAMDLIRRGSLSDLDEAITTYEWLRSVTSRAEPTTRAVLAAELCLALRLRFGHTRDLADLDAAVARGREGERGADARFAPYGFFVGNLVAALTLRSEITGNVDDLMAALRLGEAGLASLPPGHQMHAQMVANHGVAVRVRFELTADPARLDEVIAGHERIVADQHGAERALTAMNLGSLLRMRHRLAGDPADLSRAIEYHREAATTFDPADQHAEEAQGNLGVALRERFEIFRDVADSDGAIAAARAAGGDHPTAEQLVNLGTALDARGEVLHDTTAQDEAVDVYRTALAVIERGHTLRPGLLIDLAQALVDRPGATDADLAEAVRLCDDAARSGGERNPLVLSALALSLSRRADLLAGRRPTGRWLRVAAEARIGALRTRALHVGRRAVALSPPGSPGLARLHQLDAQLTLLTGPSGTRPARYRHAVEAFARAARSPMAPVVVRLAAARNWTDVAVSAGDRPGARQATQAAVDLLPLVAWPGIARSDRERELGAAGSVGADAAALAVADDDPAAAVSLVEQGRGVLWARLLEQRAPLDAVRTTAPALAARLTGIRDVLDR